jgi:pseudoazurin
MGWGSRQAHLFQLGAEPGPAIAADSASAAFKTALIRGNACNPSQKELKEMRSIKLLLPIAVATLASVGAAHAAEYAMNTMNMSAHGMFRLEPALLKIAPGDTVHFIAKDKGHDVESIAGMLPDGAQPFKGDMNKDLSVTFTKPGVYGIKCNPHYGMGMVALVVVGDPAVNLKTAEAVSQPGKAKQAFADLFKQVDIAN